MDRDEAIVQPVASEAVVVARACLRLCDLVLVMREDEIAAAAVEVERLSQILHRHRRTLDVPARTPLAPRTVPRRLSRLRRLPQREIHRMMLALVDTDACARLHVVQRASAELAVAREALHAVVDVAVERIGIALLDQLFDHGEHVRNMLRNARIGVGAAHVERVNRLEVFRDVVIGKLLPRLARLLCAADDLVVDVREVLHVAHSIALLLQITAHDVPCDKGARVADMRVVVRRHAAAVDARLARLKGLELLFLARQRIVNPQHLFFLHSLQRSDSIGGYAFLLARKAELLFRRRLHVHLIKLQIELFGDVTAHLLDVGRELRTLRHDCRVDVADAIALRTNHLCDMLQELHARHAFPAIVTVGKVPAEIAKRRRAQEGVLDGMQQHIGVRMSQEPIFMRDVDAAYDELAPCHQAVHVVSHAKSRHIVTFISSTIPAECAKSASAIHKSSGVVIFRLP